MLRIFKYSFRDLLRSRWTVLYFLFYFLLTAGLHLLSADQSNVIITLMNVILVINPLIAIVFGIMYFYNSKEFTELLLAQPVKRSHIFLGQYIGLSTSLGLSFALGLSIPFLLSGIVFSQEFFSFVSIISVGLMLTAIFSAFAFWIALSFNNRIKGFGLAIIFWLFLAVIYDGFLLLLLMAFSDYPLERFVLITSMLNPIDLSRILILLQLDISALMGYTGAIFNKFFGSQGGFLLSTFSLFFWLIFPLYLMIFKAKKKDF